MNIDYCHPDEAFLRTIDVHELLPQQEPFVFISALTALGRSHVVTETAVGSRCRLVSNGMMTTAGMIEMMAQTCAARVGYINKFILEARRRARTARRCPRHVGFRASPHRADGSNVSGH